MVSAIFRGTERPRDAIFGLGRARNETRAKNECGGEGVGVRKFFLQFIVFLQHPIPTHFPFPAVSLAPFFARSLTLVRVSRSLAANDQGIMSNVPTSAG